MKWLARLVACAGLLTAPLAAWSYGLPVRPVTVPLQLRQQPVENAFYADSYEIAISYLGEQRKMAVSSVGTVRVQPAGEYLAMTFDATVKRPPPAKGEAPERTTLRCLVTPTGELIDIVVKTGKETEDKSLSQPILAVVQQMEFLYLPRLPYAPVKTGDTIYDFVYTDKDVPFHVTGKLRGLKTHHGRDAVLIDYRIDGSNAQWRMTARGEQLIDVATGLVTSTHGSRTVSAAGVELKMTEAMELTFP
jgi:hypothetical protein